MIGQITNIAVMELSGLSISLHAVLMLALLAASAAFSASEAALFSLTPLQLERAAASLSPFRRLAAQLMRDPKPVLMTLLVSNTAVNVCLFATSYVLFTGLAKQVGAWVAPVAAVGSILLVVVFGEVLPKVIGVSLADRLAPLSATVVRVAGVVAGPLGRGLDWVLVKPAERLLLPAERRAQATDAGLSRVELRTLLEMSQRGGALMPLEDTLLRAVIDLGHLRVRDVMVPRVKMTAYEIHGSREGLCELMRTTRYKKIPVYDRSLDNISGLVYAKVLFLNPDEPLKDLVQPVRFVPELATCEQLLLHFRSTKTQLAIAVDEYGGVAGLVTLEDVIEQIVGELHDPEDVPDEPDIQPLPDGTYDISGQLGVQYWAETFGLPPRIERVATVGGLVMAELGRPAQVGDVVRFGNVELQVTRVRRRRIERLRLRLRDAAEVRAEAQ
jgi:putative hemolysin